MAPFCLCCTVNKSGGKSSIAGGVQFSPVENKSRFRRKDGNKTTAISDSRNESYINVQMNLIKFMYNDTIV